MTATDDTAEGYRDGLSGAPEPGANRSPAYHHGYRNGRDDAAGRPSRTAAQARADWRAIQQQEPRP